MIPTIIEQIERHRNFLVASHTHPDGDAIGSLLATGLALRAMGKTVHLFNESPIPAVYRFLPSVHTIVPHIDPEMAFDVAIVLDCGDIERVGQAAAHIRQAPLLINIDHHVTNTRFGHLSLVDEAACATAEIIHRIIQRMPVKIDCAMATAIYTGILTDTGSFRFSNTNRAAFAICEAMISRGANPYEVAQHVYGTYSLGRIKLLNLALDSLEIAPNGKVSVMTLTQRMLRETRTQAEDIDGLINYARRIEDIKVAALIHELGGPDNGARGKGRSQFHVSLRSDGTVDVARIAAQYGGGGHTSASGFSIEATLPELKQQLMGLACTDPELCAGP
ncbi:DHH family phosphoesterase [Desulfatitalea alkaliphila]|uniref:Bifunctional oligoribonuclease/PAP phosphatase NrnA n=1 Tax=Desulfatitalea alkaliphila TaxID=2929485 RepID=A0AA41R217_9BACT|nr:bifunctional oligoribonuclease/PAP phosphatase NrnA [Desulfatitalea alkaliphila]MCJ8501154.1 bifunctional oligoribonuclease/PAP phosphatase NrnA [Desulfatitalea alkaliphila]